MSTLLLQRSRSVGADSFR